MATTMTPPTTRTPTTPREPAQPELPALRLVPTSHLARNLARLLIVIFVLTPFVLLFVPWQQSCPANGRIIALNPDQRQQTIDAPVDGRIQRLLVRENDRVNGPRYSYLPLLGVEMQTSPGDLLLTIQDPNPNLMELLATQRRAVLERQEAARERRASFEKQIKSEEAAKAAALAGFEQRVRIARDRNGVANAMVTRARANREQALEAFQTEDRLRPEGLTARITWVTAKQTLNTREAELLAAQDVASASLKEIEALGADLNRTQNEINARIQGVTALWQGAMAELASADRELADIDLRIGRQATQDVRAPCDGVIFRVLANSASGGTLVKVGDPLLSIVPEILLENDRVVELFLDGNDAPLVTEMWKAQVLELAREQARLQGLPLEGHELQDLYRDLLNRQQLTRIPVRLQFEGYPAIQWVGWPSVAVGTFGGVVAFVDPHDDGKGKFRILVRPDPQEEATNPWPSGFSLRQGLRAQGWVQLNRVPLGWELWRRLNGFPPVVATKDPEKETKATKVKVPK